MANHAAAPSHSAAACGISISIAAGILLGLVSCSDDNASSTAATAAVVLPRQEGDSDSGVGSRFTLELPPSPYLLGGVYGERRSPRRAALSGRVTPRWLPMAQPRDHRR